MLDGYFPITLPVPIPSDQGIDAYHQAYVAYSTYYNVRWLENVPFPAVRAFVAIPTPAYINWVKTYWPADYQQILGYSWSRIAYVFIETIIPSLSSRITGKPINVVVYQYWVKTTLAPRVKTTSTFYKGGT